MSSDNTIVILKTTDLSKKTGPGHWHNMLSIGGIVSYRVSHIQAADDYDYIEKNEIHNLGAWMDAYFDRDEVFYEESEVLIEARKIEKEVGYVEYGICIIDATKYNFPNT
jgi:hypothetical protein